MKPPKRKRTSVQTSAPEAESGRKQFTSHEKCALLEGLKKFGKGDVKSIKDEFLPDRTQKNITDFIKYMTIKSKAFVFPEDKVAKAPIEQWLQLSENLTCYEDDYSFLLSKLISSIGDFETEVSTSESDQPNYSAIYQYLGALLANEDLPDLSSLDAALVMDLLEHVATQLRVLDTTEQRKLMIQKHKLLITPVDITKPKTVYHTIHQELIQQDSNLDSSADLLQGETSTTESISQPQGVAAVCGPVSVGKEVPFGKETANSSLPATESSVPMETHSSTATETEQQRQKYKSDGTDCSSKKRKRTRSISTRDNTTKAGKTVDGDADKRHLLFTLNPFAVPIQYLNFQPRTQKPQHSSDS